ncbi:MAG: hypothetical protein ACR5K5_01945 [Wolbachia sp.]
MTFIDGPRMLLRTLDVNCASFINPSIKYLTIKYLKRLADGCDEFEAVGDIEDTLFNAFWYGRPISIKVRALNYNYRIVKYSKNNINIFDSKIYIKVIIYTEALYDLIAWALNYINFW